MKNFFTTLLLISLFSIFSIFIVLNNRYQTVSTILTPSKIVINFDNSTQNIKRNICISDIETFSLEPDDEFVKKYSKKYNLSKKDIISLGYLAQEFSQENLLNKKIKVKTSSKITAECEFAEVYIDKTNYKDILLNNGYGILNGEILNINKFNKNLNRAKKLNLVVFNHHSGKFHTLECPYGKVAHDTIILPKKQLPNNAKPCKFCHQTKNNTSNKNQTKNNYTIYNIPKVKQPPLYSSDGAIETFFTDFTKTLKPSTKVLSRPCLELIKLINKAQESIDIAIYGYEEIPEITKALNNAKARGVKISFIYDENFNPEKTFYKGNSIIKQIANQSISDKTEIKSQSNMLMHNKFIIFDKKIILTGSMNISPTGTSGYDVNDIIIINSKEVAQLYSKEFDQMLNGKFHTQKSILNENNIFKIGNSEVEVYFLPKNKPTTRIIELINNAEQYIYVPTFLITHEKIANALISAQKRGVDVRVIIDANSTNTKGSKHQILRSNGILLKTENYAGKLHAKTIIIDDKYLITGSMNFSNSGENKNDENELIITNQKIAKAHKEFFLYLWTVIPNKYLKYNANPESKDSIGSCSDGIDNNFNGKIDTQEERCR